MRGFQGTISARLGALRGRLRAAEMRHALHGFPEDAAEALELERQIDELLAVLHEMVG